jgi:cyclin-dependent kinase 12/13
MTKAPPKSGVGSLCNYISYDQVGEGTYGYVFKAVDRRDQQTVALKRLIIHKEQNGFPLCAIRELKFLKSLNHPNIVKLKDIITSKGCEHLDMKCSQLERCSKEKEKEKTDELEKSTENQSTLSKLFGHLYLVFEFIEHDLAGLICAKHKFLPKSIKCILKQLLEALAYLDDRKIIHRDIKSANILISNRHHVKLADFGLARSYISSDGREDNLNLSNNVVTMWYKSPELLYGATKYNSSIDIWSVGCVIAELELGRPLFPGRTEIEQLELISQVIGVPSESNFVGISSYPHYSSMNVHIKQKFESSPSVFASFNNGLRSHYQQKMSQPIINLLERILVLDPATRPTANILLKNTYFLTAPLPPNDPMELDPIVQEGVCLHEYRTKLARRRNEEKKTQENIEILADAAEVRCIK